ncbi:MAG: hypothetical protein ACFFD2_00835 [Promethearchaeota archaeon]
MKNSKNATLIGVLFTLILILNILPISRAECTGTTNTVTIEPGEVFDEIYIYFEECDGEFYACSDEGLFQASWEVIDGPAIDVSFGDYIEIDDWYYSYWSKSLADFNNSMLSDGCINWTTEVYEEYWLVFSNYYGGSNATVEYIYSHSRETIIIPGFELMYIIIFIAILIAIKYYSKKSSKLVRIAHIVN